jgi:DNA-directed RNA polymerase subunit RPC12/RpoP
MSDYICAVCKRDIDSTEMNKVGMRCKYCNSKIFYKKRPNIKKRLLAR